MLVYFRMEEKINTNREKVKLYWIMRYSPGIIYGAVIWILNILYRQLVERLTEFGNTIAQQHAHFYNYMKKCFELFLL